jgi:hypothetical protein
MLIGQYLHLGISPHTLIPDIKAHIDAAELAMSKTRGDLDPLLYGFELDELEYREEDKAYYLPLYRNGKIAFYYKYYIDETQDALTWTIPVGDGKKVYVKVEKSLTTPAAKDTEKPKAPDMAVEEDEAAGAERKTIQGSPAKLLETIRDNPELLRKACSNKGITAAEMAKIRLVARTTINKEFEILKALRIFISVTKGSDRYRFSDMMIGPDENYTKRCIDLVIILNIRLEKGAIQGRSIEEIFPRIKGLP